MSLREDLSLMVASAPGAAELVNELWAFVEVWDDCVDSDHSEPEATINRAMYWALVARDENPFLAANPALRLALAQMVAVWQAANRLERSGDPGRVRTAYTLRCSPYLFFVSVVILAVGLDAGVRAAEMLFGDDHDDNFDAYMAEHAED